MAIYSWKSDSTLVHVEPGMLSALEAFHASLGSRTIESRKHPLVPLFASTIGTRFCELTSDRKLDAIERHELRLRLKTIDLHTASKLHMQHRIFENADALSNALLRNSEGYARDLIELAKFCAPAPLEEKPSWTVSATFDAVHTTILDCFIRSKTRKEKLKSQDPWRTKHADFYCAPPKYCKYCGEFTEYMRAMGATRSLMGHNVVVVPDSASTIGAGNLPGYSKTHCGVHASSKLPKRKRSRAGAHTTAPLPQGIHYDAAIKAGGRHADAQSQLLRETKDLKPTHIPRVLGHWLVYWRLHQNLAKARKGAYLGGSAAMWLKDIGRSFADRNALVRALVPWNFSSEQQRFVTDNVLRICVESQTGTHMVTVGKCKNRELCSLSSDDQIAAHECRDWLLEAMQIQQGASGAEKRFDQDCSKHGFEAIVDDLHVYISYLTIGEKDFTLLVEFAPRTVIESLAFINQPSV